MDRPAPKKFNVFITRILLGGLIGLAVFVILCLVGAAVDWTFKDMLLDELQRPALVTAALLSLTVGVIIGLAWAFASIT